MDFEWDPAKASENEHKHAVPFPFAARVFLDADRLERLDTRENYGEDRWVTIGLVEGFEMMVVYTLREQTIRIISARRVDRHEREAYWNR